MKPNSIYAILHTADGCTGTVRLGPTTVRAGIADGFEPLDDKPEWDREPDGETTSAMIVQTDAECAYALDEAEALDGHDWRQLEDTGELHYIAFWVRRGVSLSTAIEACQDESDPRGFNHESEEMADEIEIQLGNLKLAVEAVMPDLEHYVATHGPGPDTRLARLREVLSAATYG
jgi:hypothetical protein